MSTLTPEAPVKAPAKAQKPRGKLGDRLLFGYTWAVIIWVSCALCGVCSM